MGHWQWTLANGQHMTITHVGCYLVYTNCCHSLTRTKLYLLTLAPYRVKVYNAFCMDLHQQEPVPMLNRLDAEPVA